MLPSSHSLTARASYDKSVNLRHTVQFNEGLTRFIYRRRSRTPGAFPGSTYVYDSGLTVRVRLRFFRYEDINKAFVTLRLLAALDCQQRFFGTLDS
jgi:hypothetical protein